VVWRRHWARESGGRSGVTAVLVNLLAAREAGVVEDLDAAVVSGEEIDMRYEKRKGKKRRKKEKSQCTGPKPSPS